MLTQLARLKQNAGTNTALNFGPAPQSRPRVLIVENESILGAGIERLLADQARLDVVGVTPTNVATLMDTIKQLQPDVIILDETSLLAVPPRLLAELLDYPSLRVVVISANHNRVQIYDKLQISVTHITDLVNLIQGEQGEGSSE